MSTERFLTKAMLQEIAALKQKKFRDQTGQILVEARHPIEEALAAGLTLRKWVIQKGANPEALPKASLIQQPFEVDAAAIVRMSTTSSPPPCLAVFDAPKPSTQVQGDFALILAELQDPGNVGTLVRSAVAFGVSTVILLGDTVEAYSPKVIRASAGLIFAVNIIEAAYKDLTSTLPPSTWTLLTTTGQHQAKPYRDIDFKGPCALVLGNEGRGVPKSLLQDFKSQAITIPMTSRVESLNVAVSGSIIMAEAAAKRHQRTV